MRPGTAAAIVGGAVVSVAAAPLVLWSAGFTTAGIAAGSLAAKMMSAVAIANGGGVAAGSAVAVLQSAGAAGLSGTATAAVASVGGAVGGLLSIFRRKPSDDDGDPPDGDDGDRPDGEDGDPSDGDNDIPMLLLESDHLCISEKSNSELVLQSKCHY